MKILLLAPQTPYPPDQGAAIRNYYFIRYYATRPNTELVLLAFARPGEDPLSSPALPELRQYCKQVVLVPHPRRRSRYERVQTLLTQSQPDLSFRLRSAIFAATLDSVLKSFRPDVIQCEGLELAPYLINSKGKRLVAETRLILDQHNAEYRLQERIFASDRRTIRRLPQAAYSLMQARKLKQWERTALASFDRTLVVSDGDKLSLQELGFTKSPVLVIPNGIDTEELTLSEEPTRHNDLIFTGTMDFRPNVDAVIWFAREILPLVRQKVANARFIIVGHRPTAPVKALASLAGVEVTGSVASAQDYIRRGVVYVVPMRMGGGVRFKVLEAMALGTPVVSTSMGAEGIALEPGRDALIADAPVAFANAITELVNSPLRRSELARYGRLLVEQRYDWRKLLTRVEEALK